MNRKIIAFIPICILFLIVLNGCSNLNDEQNIENSIDITVSSKITPTNVSDKESAYYYDYLNYEDKQDYMFYDCIVKVKNRSDYYIGHIFFPEFESDKGEYKSHFYDGGLPFLIEPHQTEYIAIAISVNKNLSQEKIDCIISEIPRKIRVNLCSCNKNDKENNFTLNYVDYCMDSFEVTDEDYSHHNIQYPEYQ